jgi:hypothetical protein
MGLFKYTDHFGVDIIRNLQLKVTPPNELNDPFEFSPYLVGKITDEFVQALMTETSPIELYEKMKKSGVQKMPQFEKFAESLKELIPQVAKDTVPFFQSWTDEIISNVLNEASNQIGLVCFSEEENNILLWSHYTDGHKGMLIEFESSHEYFTKHSKFQNVTYSEQRVPFDPTWPEDSLNFKQINQKIIYTKNSHWSYEKEWRSKFPLTLDWCQQKTVDQKILYFTHIPPNLIRRIVLGYRCSPEIERQVREAREQKNLKFSLEKAFLHPTEFKVEYKPI